MTVVVGFTPTADGRAALLAAAEGAGQRQMPVVVVNSSRGDERPRFRATSQAINITTRSHLAAVASRA
jgi:hypothetical protein